LTRSCRCRFCTLLSLFFSFFFFFTAPSPTEFYTLSLHDALPISFARLYACAVREPADCGGDESRDRPEFQSAGECSSESPCGDRPQRGLPARWPGGYG